MTATTFLQTRSGGLIALDEAVEVSATSVEQIEGSVSLRDGATEILERSAVTVVVPLWASLLHGLETVAGGTPYLGSYPDVSLPLSIRELPPRAHERYALVRCGRPEDQRSAAVPWSRLVTTVADGATACADGIEALAGRYARELGAMRAHASAVRALS